MNNGVNHPQLQSMLNSSITYSGVSAAYKMFNDTANKCIKTPISLLQEICAKSQAIPPTYELMQTNGRAHDPLFVYKCSIGDKYVISGKGASKKKAKHAAALGVLNQLAEANKGVNDKLAETLEGLIQSLNDLDIENITNNVLDEASETNITANPESVFDQYGSNPVSELIEIAQIVAKKVPDFEFGEEEGPPHNRQFECIVKFHLSDDQIVTEQAYGRSKKLAKRAVALKLLMSLKKIPMVQDKFFAKRNGDGADIAKCSSLLPTKNSKSGKMGQQQQLTNICTQLRASQHETAKFLLETSLDQVDSVLNSKLLEKLAAEEQFKYEIHKSNERSTLCILRLKTNPPVIGWGDEKTYADSHKAAIHMALKSLRILCKDNSAE